MDSKLVLFLTFSAILLLVPSIQARKLSYCDKKHYPVKVKSIDMAPYPVRRGVQTNFTITASTDEGISGGKMKIDVSYFILHVHSESHDICEKTQCPVSPGGFVLTHSQVLPGITPPGSYTLTLKMSGANGGLLTCINYDFSIGILADESVADS